MAAGTGINVALLSGLVFAAGAGLAAFGGVMGGPILGGYPASISISCRSPSSSSSSAAWAA